MSYGIYDCDILNGAPMFNLELMKLSSYYKSRGEIVAYSARFHPERFNHFIVGKDRIDENFKYPIYEYDNIETIGRFFSPKKYYPMDLSMEKQVADTYIYNWTAKRPFLQQNDLALCKSQLQAEHLRLSLDGKVVWDDYKTQLYGRSLQNTVSIYDYDIAKVKFAIPTLQELLIFPNRKRPRPLLLKYPIRVDHAQDIEPWLQFSYFQNRVVFIIERALTTEDIGFLIENQEELKSKNIMCNISKNTTYSDFTNNITTIYKQIYFLRTILQNFSLIYDEGFFQDSAWENLISLLNGFLVNYWMQINHKRKPAPTLYEYVNQSIYKKGKVANLTIEEARKCFLSIAQLNYSLFKDFYEYEGENK